MTRTLTVLLVGIAIGILIAPEKGEVTRKKLSDLYDEFTGDDENEKTSFPSGSENRDTREDLAF